MINQLNEQLRKQEVTSEALVKQSLSEIKTYQAQGGKAYISIDEQLSLSIAKAADQLHLSDFYASKLSGLPVSIKDLYDVKDQVTASGSTVLANSAPATKDAVAVERLRTAGAVPVGRTNMSEFAFSGLGLNPHYGTPTFADSYKRIAGGSTSGGAVSVALGHVVAALGSDTGGSLRIPAAFCGLVGFKPSSERISKEGAFPLSYSLDTIGSITKTVADNIIVDEILSGIQYQPQNLRLEQLHLAITDDYFLDDIEPEVLKAYEQSLEKLRAAGVTLHKIKLEELYEIPKINSAGGLTAAEAWFTHHELLNDPAKLALYDPRVAVRVLRGKKISSLDYLITQQKRHALIQAVGQKLAPFNALLHPTVAITPPLLAPLEKDDDLFTATNALVLRNTTAFNFLDGCALSLPCHEANALPVGMSIAGMNGQDHQILHISSLIENLLST